MPSEINGTVAPGFERVADAFHDTVGAPEQETSQCCVHVDGERVVDLWSGPRNAVEVVFSATKGATAACANLLVQRGLLDLDAPVTAYWPEYGVRGKDRTLVRWILSHKAGVPAPEPGLSLDDISDWGRVVAALAAQAPAWEPGTAYGYHAHTFGYLVGELVRRVDGRPLGRFFAEEIAGPARADFWIGLPGSEEHRVAPIILEQPAMPPGMGPSDTDMSAFVGPYLMAASTLGGALPEDIAEAANDRRYRAAGLGGAGAVSSGSGLSRVYAWLLENFTPQTIADILRPETEGPDLVLSSPAMVQEQRIGRGFEVTSTEDSPVGVPTFGHNGSGGITAFADPAHRVAFGYATTRIILGPPGTDPKARALTEAVYQSLH